MFVFIPHWNKELKCQVFFSGWKFWEKKENTTKQAKFFFFFRNVKAFCLTFSNKTKHFNIPEMKMFSCGVLKWPPNALFKVTSVFKLCFPLVSQPSGICSLEVYSMQSPCLDCVSCVMPKHWKSSLHKAAKETSALHYRITKSVPSTEKMSWTVTLHCYWKVI